MASRAGSRADSNRSGRRGSGVGAAPKKRGGAAALDDRKQRRRDEEVRDEGAEVVVMLSHNGFDVDKKMASVVSGIDVILSGHTHDALPEPVLVGETIILPSGSNGKFVTRCDLDIRDGRMMGRTSVSSARASVEPSAAGIVRV